VEDFKAVYPQSIMDEPDALLAYNDALFVIQRAYKEMVKAGVPKEDARYILPNATCTNIVVTMNGRELRHFFELRLCSHAQWEIRELASLMLTECRKVAPGLFHNAGPKCHDCVQPCKNPFVRPVRETTS
jgi:thymidylate synthase (FAD)